MVLLNCRWSFNEVYVAREWINLLNLGGLLDSILKQNVKVGCLESNFEPNCIRHHCFAFILFIFTAQYILSRWPVRVKGSLKMNRWGLTDILLNVPELSSSILRGRRERDAYCRTLTTMSYRHWNYEMVDHQLANLDAPSNFQMVTG